MPGAGTSMPCIILHYHPRCQARARAGGCASCPRRRRRRPRLRGGSCGEAAVVSAAGVGGGGAAGAAGAAAGAAAGEGGVEGVEGVEAEGACAGAPISAVAPSGRVCGRQRGGCGGVCVRGPSRTLAGPPRPRRVTARDPLMWSCLGRGRGCERRCRSAAARRCTRVGCRAAQTHKDRDCDAQRRATPRGGPDQYGPAAT